MVTLNKKESNKFVKVMLKKEKEPFLKKDKKLAKELKENMSKLQVNDYGLCQKCKKNKATITYANSILDYTHGFSESICQGCYDKIKKDNTWYKEGREECRKEFMQEEIKFLKTMLQTKGQKELSKARTQDTGKNTIPDIYDIKINRRIKELRKLDKKIR